MALCLRSSDSGNYAGVTIFNEENRSVAALVSGWLVTQTIVLFCWIPFRAKTLADSLAVISGIFTWRTVMGDHPFQFPLLCWCCRFFATPFLSGCCDLNHANLCFDRNLASAFWSFARWRSA